MTGERRVWLDDSPGEMRGVIADGAGFQQVLTHCEGEPDQRRLEARSVGRVQRVEPNLKGAFVELVAGDGGAAFLPLKGGQRVHIGEKVEVEVVSEARERKGVTLKLLGRGEGEPRLLARGPTVPEWLERLAPGVEPIRGAPAIEAGWAAIDEAEGQPFDDDDLDVAVERTRAMVAVDFDYRPSPGRRVSPHDRLEANRRGLRLTARTLRLRSLGGLVAVDLIGVGHDGEALMKTARAAFGPDPEIAFGPVNRFGVMMISLPWRFTPLAERLRPPAGGPEGSLQVAAREATRRLRHALLSDTAAPRMVVRVPAAVAERAAPLVARLGPRAHVRADDSLQAGDEVLETG